MPFPFNWKKAPLKDTCQIIMGQSPPSNTYNTEGQGLPFFQGKAEFGKKFPTPLKYCRSPQKIAEKSDILISVRAPVGPTNICFEKSCIGRGLAALRPVAITSEYLFYFLRFIEPWIATQGTGSTFSSISRKHIETIEIPVAPSYEQHRIIAKLEKLLAKVDQCQARLEKIPGILENFRTTIISAACTGKLTKDWRQKNKDAKSASSGPQHPTPNKKSQKKPSYFQRNWFEELPASWSWAYLSEISDCRLGKMLDKSKNKGEKTRYLRNINVRWFTVDLTDLLEIRASAEDKKKLRLKQGDVLVCEGGEPGRAAVWNREDPDIIYQKALHRVRSDGSFLPSWLVYNLKNDSKNWRLASLFTGTTIKHLTGQSLAKYPLAIPPIGEQKEIIRRIEKLFQFADQVENRYHKTKTHIDHLTQAILAKAFRGELVPQDPNDEPAAELLKRIQAEKAGCENQGRKKTTDKKQRKIQKTAASVK